MYTLHSIKAKSVHYSQPTEFMTQKKQEKCIFEIFEKSSFKIVTVLNM